MDTHLRTDGAIRTPLEAGESKTVTVTSYGRFAQVLDYRVKSTDASWQTEFRPASVALGEQIRANEQTLLEVEAVRTQSQLELLAGGEKEPQGAGEDKYFVAVKCHWARAVDDVASRSPGEGSFTIGTENIDDVGTRWQLGNRASIAEPWHSRVEKSLDRHTDVTGWYVWTVDTDFAPEDLLVHYERDADSGENFEPLVVEWTQE